MEKEKQNVSSVPDSCRMLTTCLLTYNEVKPAGVEIRGFGVFLKNKIHAMRSYVLVRFGSELSSSQCKKGNAISEGICDVNEIKTNWLLRGSPALSRSLITIYRMNE